MSDVFPLKAPKPDIETFVRVIRGEEIPSRPPFVELFLDHEIVRDISRTMLGRDWVEPGDSRDSWEAYLKNWIEVYYRLGYDFVRVSGGLVFPSKSRIADDTADMSKGSRSWSEEGIGAIASWDDYEAYPWPDPEKADIWRYEFVANNLPDGMGLFVCPVSGFFEVPIFSLFGYENFCYLVYDNPELVAAVFERVGESMLSLYMRIMKLPNVYGFFQGDDMGFKTGTLVGPGDLRKYALPWHKKAAELAHQNGLLYLLHSCGHLEHIIDDLIDDVKIDARHSFEDEGNPVQEFKHNYGDRVAVLGGVDIDKLCHLPEDYLRLYVRDIIKYCMPGGRFALGSGNSIANYVPINNYLAMLEEGLAFGG